jgi:hypothetical protein
MTVALASSDVAIDRLIATFGIIDQCALKTVIPDGSPEQADPGANPQELRPVD